jgi:hypothetical protein
MVAVVFLREAVLLGILREAVLLGILREAVLLGIPLKGLLLGILREAVFRAISKHRRAIRSARSLRTCRVLGQRRSVVQHSRLEWYPLLRSASIR